MKTSCFLPVLLLVATTASGQLQTPDADRLAAYRNWFAPLDPAAGLVAPGLPSPGPTQIDDGNRDWSSWMPNTPPTNLFGPIISNYPWQLCEVVFLGQTGDGWGQFGYCLNGVDHLLSQSGADRQFGDYAHPQPGANQRLDFFVERITSAGNRERYYAFEQALNSPLAPAADGYWGSLTPLSEDHDGQGATFTLLAFAPEVPGYGGDPALLVFAVRAGSVWIDTPIPEPATYGLAAAAVLLALAARHRRHIMGPPAAAT